MISGLYAYNQVRQQTPHSFRFEDIYDSLCYKFYLQDIEKENLRLKTERIEPLVENYAEDTKPLIEAQCPINCPEFWIYRYHSYFQYTYLQHRNHIETEESLEDSTDQEERNDKTHTEGKDFSDSRTDISITLNTSHTETLSTPFEEEPIDKNLRLLF